MFAPERYATAHAHRVQTRVSGRSQVRLATEALVVVGLLTVAALARLPNLLAIPVFTDEVEEMPNRIGIDTGAFMSGRLTALGLEGSGRWYLVARDATARADDQAA